MCLKCKLLIINFLFIEVWNKNNPTITILVLSSDWLIVINCIQKKNYTMYVYYVYKHMHVYI